MLTRRHILLASATATSSLVIGSATAHALSLEPMPAEDVQAMSASCRASVSHAEIVAAMRQQLDGEVSQGLRPADYLEMVPCPFCRCGLSVTPELKF